MRVVVVEERLKLTYPKFRRGTSASKGEESYSYFSRQTKAREYEKERSVRGKEKYHRVTARENPSTLTKDPETNQLVSGGRKSFFMDVMKKIDRHLARVSF